MLFSRKNSQDDVATPDVQPRKRVGSVERILPVQEVSGNMLVMKDKSFRVIMKSTAINMDLLSLDEQMDRILTFRETLMMLQEDWPLQIMLQSSYMNTDHYTQPLRQQLRDPATTPEMAAMIEDHIDHFEYLAELNNWLERNYYIVVCYNDPFSTPAGDTLSSSMPLGGLIARTTDRSTSEQAQTVTPQEKQRARTQLQHRASAIATQLSRLEIECEFLNEFELIRLLRSMYNPGAPRADASHGGPIGTLVSSSSSGTDQRRARRGVIQTDGSVDTGGGMF